MRIKTKSGEVIDLDEVRTRYVEALAGYKDVTEDSHSIHRVAARNAREDLALLDALEAALSVQSPYLTAEECTSLKGSEADFFQRGLRRGAETMLRVVRQAAGVVEDEA